jgi:hypothetical protein
MPAAATVERQRGTPHPHLDLIGEPLHALVFDLEQATINRPEPVTRGEMAGVNTYLALS